ncbi:CHASE2 domain-containing protein [Flammeovirga kamogawensis]|uniref:CHASE2 domain-containing protein n=2 Tax=Flammeovirga kamogawensis TaxID=373891 RepID=A0ABX8GWY1_9BACT|nr:CHASE2 domain-containing protein [Flammeovirga kamogawensis]QWG08113.1 CHASE2 domain-containing protein [Flammeovirga kamogawensis]TRX69916.1 CHASE2 domain-containing protein [Flammeovirga kamogawensis]
MASNKLKDRLIFRMQKNKPLMWGISSFHALIMMVGLMFYMSIVYVMPDEIMLIELLSATRNALFKAEIKPKADRFLFVNCSWEKDLTAKVDTNGFVIGNVDITNRKSITKFVNTLNQDPDNHEYLLVDIRFYDKSEDDSLMEAAFANSKNTIVSYHKGADNAPKYPVVKVPLGLSDLQVQELNHEETVTLKYHLIQGDSLKSTPLIMAENIYGEKIQKGFLFNKFRGNYMLNSYILDYPIRTYDLFVKNTYPYLQMHELINMPPFLIKKFTKDKIIVLGDFEDRDIHKTIYGFMPGPLILTNAFITLERGYNKITWGFFLFIFICFTYISHKALTFRDPVTVFINKFFDSDHFIVELIQDSVFYLVYFGVMSIVSYLTFNIHLTVLILSFYMYALEQGLLFYKGWLEDKEKEDLEKDTVEENIT